MDYLAAMRCFVRAAALGSFSKAAAEAGVKVSTVSRYVTALEADLGAAILNRSTRGLHLTEAGRAFHARAVQVLQDVEDARNATRSLNARPQGLLRVALPGAFGRRHVMPLMRGFLDDNPDIRLDATLADTPVDLIDAGFDVAVRLGAMTDSALVGKRLAAETFMLVGGRDYLAGRPAPRTPSELARHECLLTVVNGREAWHGRNAADGSAFSPVEANGRLRTNDLEVLRQAVVDGDGIALLPTWLCDDALREGRVGTVLPHWQWRPAPGTARAVWGLYPPKRIVSPKVKAFLAFLATRLRAPPWADASAGAGEHPADP